MVKFDWDEVARIRKWQMIKYYNIEPQAWDSMTYADQCDALEYFRAQNVIQERQANLARQGRR